MRAIRPLKQKNYKHSEVLKMIKTVSQTTIADVFSITSDKIYKIPTYQREYTWGIKEWDAFIQ